MYNLINPPALKLYIFMICNIAATPLEASRGTGRRGENRPHPILNLSFKRVLKILFWGEGGEHTLSKIV